MANTLTREQGMELLQSKLQELALQREAQWRQDSQTLLGTRQKLMTAVAMLRAHPDKLAALKPLADAERKLVKVEEAIHLLDTGRLRQDHQAKQTAILNRFASADDALQDKERTEARAAAVAAAASASAAAAAAAAAGVAETDAAPVAVPVPVAVAVAVPVPVPVAVPIQMPVVSGVMAKGRRGGRGGGPGGSRRGAGAASQEGPVQTATSGPPQAPPALQRQDLVAQFCAEADVLLGTATRPVTLSAFDTCPRCHVTLRYNQTLQQLVCPMPHCDHWKRFADMTSSALLYGEEVQFIQYAYKPETHLDDIMKLAEASETHVVPMESLVRVMEHLRANGITSPEDITIPMVRRACKAVKVKMDNSVQIYCRLTGRAPRRMTTFMKDQMRIMFHSAEGAFRRHAAGRTNHLSFPFTLRKYCELLGYWEMLDSLPMLRCASNVVTHDAIMSRVFNDMGWSFAAPIAKEAPEAALAPPGLGFSAEALLDGGGSVPATKAPKAAKTPKAPKAPRAPRAAEVVSEAGAGAGAGAPPLRPKKPRAPRGPRPAGANKRPLEPGPGDLDPSKKGRLDHEVPVA